MSSCGQTRRVYFCPFNGFSAFINATQALLLNDKWNEFICIREDLVLVYNSTEHTNPEKDGYNRNLQIYGHIFANIPGDAILYQIDIEDGEPIDIEDNVMLNLHAILKADQQKRQDVEFVNEIDLLEKLIE